MNSFKKSFIEKKIYMLDVSCNDLKNFIDSLDANNSITVITIVLTSYNTWLARTLYVKEETTDLTFRKRIQRLNKDENDDDSNDDEINEKEYMNQKSRCADLFDQVICNEMHKLKIIRSKSSRVIVLLDIFHLLLLTVTSMMNKSSNLIKLLFLLWREEFNHVIFKSIINDYVEVNN